MNFWISSIPQFCQFVNWFFCFITNILYYIGTYFILLFISDILHYIHLLQHHFFFQFQKRRFFSFNFDKQNTPFSPVSLISSNGELGFISKIRLIYSIWRFFRRILLNIQKNRFFFPFLSSVWPFKLHNWVSISFFTGVPLRILHFSDFRPPCLEIRSFAFGKGRSYSGVEQEMKFKVEGS